MNFMSSLFSFKKVSTSVIYPRKDGSFSICSHSWSHFKSAITGFHSALSTSRFIHALHTALEWTHTSGETLLKIFKNNSGLLKTIGERAIILSPQVKKKYQVDNIASISDDRNS